MPVPGADPVPGIGVKEPDPNRLPDEEPVPNPDENPDPPQQAIHTCARRSGGCSATECNSFVQVRSTAFWCGSRASSFGMASRGTSHESRTTKNTKGAFYSFRGCAVNRGLQ